jgi:hypothetical protein
MGIDTVRVTLIGQGAIPQGWPIVDGTIGQGEGRFDLSIENRAIEDREHGSSA